MSYSAKKSIHMIVFGFMLALFMSYGYVSIFAHPWPIFMDADVSLTGYVIKLIIGMTLLAFVGGKKKAARVGTGVIAALLAFSILYFWGGRALTANLGGYIACMVFVGLLAAFLLMPKRARAWRIMARIAGAVCFIVSIYMGMFSIRGDFVGLDTFTKALSTRGFPGLCTFFFSSNYLFLTPSKLSYFPFSVSLNFMLLDAAFACDTEAPEANPNEAVAQTEDAAGAKSRTVAGVLAAFLGMTGAHRYYLGYRKQGVLQTLGLVSMLVGWSFYLPAIRNHQTLPLLISGVLLSYGTGVAIWALVDFIHILTGKLAPADGTAYTHAEKRNGQTRDNA